jgi:hypothetical protein
MKLHVVQIVLDGMPYLPLHLPQFERLSCDWNYTIVHGAAANTGSTSWCQEQTPRLSRDGSSEFINSLTKHPRVTVIQRQWWPGGKDEMFRTALERIKEPGVLFMPDVDEIFTTEQIEKIVKLFEDRPQAMRMLFYCRYFIGQNILATGDNCWGNRGGIEWLRAFRFRAGDTMNSHEPPVVAGNKGLAISREETRKMGLVFDHFSWVLESNVLAKLRYYKYGEQHLDGWRRLQANKQWPISDLKAFLPWVGNGVTADLFENVFPNEINPTSQFK